ncbi:MAG: hypothetical protein PHN59_05940 [Candidatus Omnitrophica bacterium]|nr:hypothetical protein [Candidatus Omnitrophota bacterium]
MFKKKRDLPIKGKTDEELELELKKQALRAKLYFLVTAIVLIALVSAYKLVKNFQNKKSAEEVSPENTTIEEPGSEEGIVILPSEPEGSPQGESEEYYFSPDDSSDDSGPIIIEESDPGDSGPQEEIIEY